jgi:hypothetical protein
MGQVRRRATGYHMTGKFGRAAGVAAMIAFGCAQAQAARNECWTAQEVSAAKVRDLQTMLMVAGLRCRSGGADVLSGYNRFVSANRAALVEVNDRLKLHFRALHGQAEGQRNYDRFTTALANAYGAGGSGTGNCAHMASLAAEASSARGSAALIAIAEDRGVSPELPTCPVRMAAR